MKLATSFIDYGADGSPELVGNRCRACGAIMLNRPLACPACCAADGFDAAPLASSGTLHSWSIVHRSYPGVAVPFVSAIVDLDDGIALKGNLRGVKAEPAAIQGVSRVKIVFDDSLGRVDEEGEHYISYFFEPAGDGA